MESYRSVRLLPNISKVCERCHRWVNNFMIIFMQSFHEINVGFENYLLHIIERWRESLDQGGSYEAVLIDFSKAFDCLSHELIITKLYTYGVDMLWLKLTNSYLSKRRQRIKLMMFIAHGPKYLLGYLRTPYFVHYCLIYLYVTFICSKPKVVLLITLMIIPRTQQVVGFTTFYLV